MLLKLCNCFVRKIAMSSVFVDIWELFPTSTFVAYICDKSAPPIIILSAVSVFVLFNASHYINKKDNFINIIHFRFVDLDTLDVFWFLNFLFNDAYERLNHIITQPFPCCFLDTA